MTAEAGSSPDMPDLGSIPALYEQLSWCIPVIPAPEGEIQGQPQFNVFEAILGYTTNA